MPERTEKETQPVLPLSAFTSWLAAGERGISSSAIVSALTRQQVGRREFSDIGYDHPHDPDDFRRCEILLRQVPLARLTFVPVISGRSAVWAALAGSWDQLVGLLESEVPGVFAGRPPRGATAPLTYALMKQLIRSAQTPGVGAGAH